MGEIQSEKSTFGGIEINPGRSLLGVSVAFFRQQVREAGRRLREMGLEQEDIAAALECRSGPLTVELYIDRQYRIYMDSRQGVEIPFRPLKVHWEN